MIKLTEQEVLQYLGVDYVDEDVSARIQGLIKSADRYLQGAVGFGYPESDPRAKELALMYIDELWESHGRSTIVGSNMKKIMHDLEWQLKCELRRSDRNGL